MGKKRLASQISRSAAGMANDIQRQLSAHSRKAHLSLDLSPLLLGFFFFTLLLTFNPNPKINSHPPIIIPNYIPPTAPCYWLSLQGPFCVVTLQRKHCFWMFQTRQRWVDAQAARGYDYTPCSPQTTWLKTGRVEWKKKTRSFSQCAFSVLWRGWNVDVWRQVFPTASPTATRQRFASAKDLHRLQGCWPSCVFKSNRQRQGETEKEWCAVQTQCENRGEQTDVDLSGLHIILFT